MEFRCRDALGQGDLRFDGADLSQGGAFIKSQLLLEVDEVLTAEVHLPGIARPVRVQARVAWVRRFPKGDEEAGMGIAFLAMEDRQRVILNQYLEP